MIFWIAAIIVNVFSYYHNEIWVSISTSVLIGLLLVLTFLRISKNNSLFVQTGKKSTKNKMMTRSQSSKERKQPVITNFIFDYKSSFIEPLARMNSL